MTNKKEKKPYKKPEIVYETKLEVRAGTPNSLTDPLFPSGPIPPDKP